MNIDKDLEFLLEIPSHKLNGLVGTIIYDENDTIRNTETLTVSSSFEENFPDHSKYVDEIIDEVLCFGGNLIMNIMRGLRGPSYHKVISKVCKKLNVFESNKDIEFYERKILDNMSTIIQGNDVTSQCVLHIARLRKGV
jgi:uncharacterized protein YaaW (UPF0174 family)